MTNDTRQKPLYSLTVTEAIVRFAYFIDQSSRYQSVKRAVYNVLENPHSRARHYFDGAMALLVLTSIFLLVYEVKHGLANITYYTERVVVTLFIVEYALRFWVFNHNHKIIIEFFEHAQLIGSPVRVRAMLAKLVRRKWEYITSPLAIIDLLAILPTYRPLRILRIFLLFRLFKLFRYARSINEFSKVLLERRFEFYTLAVFLGFVVFAASTAIYIFEGGNENAEITDFFDAIYWAFVTITTVGYGDITPATTEGRVVAIVLILSGIGVLSFTTSIVVAAFAEKFELLREYRFFSDLDRLKDYTIICGYGRVGEVVAQMLKNDYEDVLIVDTDATVVARAKNQGFLAIQGDAGEDRLLRRIENRRPPKLILCLTTDDVTNVYITLTARNLNKHVKIISRANKPESVKKMELAGADHVIAPYEVVGLIASESIGQPVAFEAIYGMLTGHKYYTIDTVVWPSLLKGRSCTIGQIDFRRYKILLLGVATASADSAKTERSYKLKKHSFIFNPPEEFEISENKTLVVFGHRMSIEYFRDQLATAKAVAFGKDLA